MWKYKLVFQIEREREISNNYNNNEVSIKVNPQLYCNRLW